MVQSGPAGNLLCECFKRMSIQVHAQHDGNELITSKPTSDSLIDTNII
jgi:hypothetical protein